MGRRGFVEDKILVGLEAGTLARIKRVIPKKMSRGAFIRQAIENEIELHEFNGWRAVSRNTPKVD